MVVKLFNNKFTAHSRKIRKNQKYFRWSIWVGLWKILNNGSLQLRSQIVRLPASAQWKLTDLPYSILNHKIIKWQIMNTNIKLKVKEKSFDCEKENKV